MKPFFFTVKKMLSILPGVFWLLPGISLGQNAPKTLKLIEITTINGVTEKTEKVIEMDAKTRKGVHSINNLDIKNAPNANPGLHPIATINATQPPTVKLGIQTKSAKNEAQIEEVTPESAADKAGLLKGDIIQKINGLHVDQRTLGAIIRSQNPGDVLQLTVNRNGDIISLSATLEAPTESELAPPIEKMETEKIVVKRPMLGVYLKMVDGEVAVSNVIENSPASKMNLEENDIITSINGQKITDYESLVNKVKSIRIGQDISVKYKRNGKKYTAKAPMELVTTESVANDRFIKPRNTGPIKWIMEKEEMSRNAPSELEKEIIEIIRNAEESEDVTITINRVIKSDNEAGTYGDQLAFDFQCFPNPGNGPFQLQFESETNKQYMLKVVDSANRTLIEKNYQGTGDQITDMLDLGANPSDFVIITIQSDGLIISKKLIVH